MNGIGTDILNGSIQLAQEITVFERRQLQIVHPFLVQEQLKVWIMTIFLLLLLISLCLVVLFVCVCWFLHIGCIDPFAALVLNILSLSSIFHI